MVIILDEKKRLLEVLGVWQQLRKYPKLSREEALKRVTEGIGKGSLGMSGSEYVDSIRDIWKGLLPRE